MGEVTVAIPVRDGGAALRGVLRALAAQSVAHELLVCDSGSRDGSAELARANGARVLEIASSQYSHGGTRNLLMAESAGTHVALLSQDAEPADAHWLGRLLAGFQLADDVGLVYGPYRPRADAAAAVGLELARWFGSLAPDGAPRVDRLAAGERVRPQALMGARGFFTDANACIARAAWERAPFREVAYAEDRLLALDMLGAGYAKAYVPDAAVLHSHEYSACQELQRGFDEWRGLREIYGWREPCSPAQLARGLRGELGFARAQLERRSAAPAERRATLAAVARHHVVRRAGALLGSRAGRLPAGARRRLSLEGRDSFEPLHLGEISVSPTS
jgi:GT2 family glycosyltransferase